jgi:transposase
MPPKLAALEQALIAQVAAHNDWTLAQLCQWAAQQHGVSVSIATMWKTLARLGLSLKKSRSMRPSRTAPT